MQEQQFQIILTNCKVQIFTTYTSNSFKLYPRIVRYRYLPCPVAPTGSINYLRWWKHNINLNNILILAVSVATISSKISCLRLDLKIRLIRTKICTKNAQFWWETNSRKRFWLPISKRLLELTNVVTTPAYPANINIWFWIFLFLCRDTPGMMASTAFF